MSRVKKGQEYNADNSHACLNDFEGSFQTLLNAKNQRKGNSIEAALHPIIVVKNASVGTEAEVMCGRYNAIPCVVGGGNCSFYPHCTPDSFNSQAGRGFFKSKSVGDRDDYSIQ